MIHLELGPPQLGHERVERRVDACLGSRAPLGPCAKRVTPRTLDDNHSVLLMAHALPPQRLELARPGRHPPLPLDLLDDLGRPIARALVLRLRVRVRKVSG